MTPEEEARVKIDRQLNDAGWEIVPRNEYVPLSNAVAVKEGLMQGNKESDYLLFIEDKAIAVIEAKAEKVKLGEEAAKQAEEYATHPISWNALWCKGLIPLVYLANGEKIYFKNLLNDPKGKYVELTKMHTPKKMLQLIGRSSEYGALPILKPQGLRKCQFEAEINLEQSLKNGKKKALAILATGAGKTYLACLGSYRLLNYTPVKRVLFLVDRNNLARQTESEFSLFKRTENGIALNELYTVNRLRHEEDINGDIVISTIQKLYAVLTGNVLTDESDDDRIDEFAEEVYEASQEAIDLGDKNKLRLRPDHFQFIVIDECHRSIYGKWKAVLDYFQGAVILGLTATPTPEAYSFFDNNVIEKYTYEESVVEGVNVPARVYRIKTEITEHGGSIEEGAETEETTKRTGETTIRNTGKRVDFAPEELDRSVIVPKQIEEVLTAYRDGIYTDLYPDREESWEYIPKTLIFAKDDHHATKIVEAAQKVFGEKFAEGRVPDKFVQKITYSVNDTNGLIRELRTEKAFRIAVTVTLVATGTDIRPLEVVLFMNDVKSDLLYTQMKGRGCRVISDDRLKELTPNAYTKECYYIVDAVGVTESEKNLPGLKGKPKEKVLSLKELMEHLAHGEVSDENLILLGNYCASINRRYEQDDKFRRHLEEFIASFDFAPRTLANSINEAIEHNTLPPYIDISDDNTERKKFIFCLIGNVEARKKLLDMQKGYFMTVDRPDKLISAGFSKETALDFIKSFEKYITENKDKIEALRIIYNSEKILITHTMLRELKDKLMAENRTFTPYNIWHNYKVADSEGRVDGPDIKQNVNILTHLIQIVRYAYGKTLTLNSLYAGYAQRFNLYCGQAQRTLTDEQRKIMKAIADYIVNEGAISDEELNDVDADLWRKGVQSFGGVPKLRIEMQSLARFILKVA